MPAFSSIEITRVPLSRSPISVFVYRYRPGYCPEYESLPNVRVLSIQHREGADPGTARFRYVFDSSNSPDDPISFQDALSTDSDLPGVVQHDERLVVFTFTSQGQRRALFDGFAQVPELDLSADQELVTFLAVGVAIREWDTPVGGALMRDADGPTLIKDIETDLITHFNPRGQPNATPAGADTMDQAGNQYPAFLDPLVIRNPDIRRFWTIPMAISYICHYYNSDQLYVNNPDTSILDALLDSRSPKDGVEFSPDDSLSYVSSKLVVADYPATGKVWPAVVRDLLEPNGFGMSFRLQTDLHGNPFTTLEIFRRQAGESATYKDLHLQAYGETLNPARTNISQARLARDLTGIANAFTVESDLIRYEASFVLAPGFPISGSDAINTPTLKAFDRNDPAFAQSNHDRYRLYIFDETGEGHWDFVSSSMVASVPSLNTLLQDGGFASRSFVKRRRVPFGDLLSTDANRKPLKPQLAISSDYSGPTPGLWNGTGTWQTVMGGFELLRDRLGIWISVQNPNSWYVGASQLAGAPYPAGVVKGVEDQATPGSTHFSLRLTCVIESDHILLATAKKRPASSSTFVISRRVDARDHYVKWVKGPRSEFNLGDDFVVVRDDSLSAQADANARRLCREAGEVAGTVTIPRFTSAYQISDKIRSIQGRGLSLRTNAGASTEEGQVFPTVVGLTWEFDEKQHTILNLCDHRGDGQ
jgi:hypothetical protein